jgi:hypothetical protein
VGTSDCRLAGASLQSPLRKLCTAWRSPSLSLSRSRSFSFFVVRGALVPTQCVGSECAANTLPCVDRAPFLLALAEVAWLKRHRVHGPCHAVWETRRVWRCGVLPAAFPFGLGHHVRPDSSRALSHLCLCACVSTIATVLVARVPLCAPFFFLYRRATLVCVVRVVVAVVQECPHPSHPPWPWPGHLSLRGVGLRRHTNLKRPTKAGPTMDDGTAL